MPWRMRWSAGMSSARKLVVCTSRSLLSWTKLKSEMTILSLQIKIIRKREGGLSQKYSSFSKTTTSWNLPTTHALMELVRARLVESAAAPTNLIAISRRLEDVDKLATVSRISLRWAEVSQLVSIWTWKTSFLASIGAIRSNLSTEA